MLLSREEMTFDFGGAKLDPTRDRELLEWMFNQFLYGEITGIQGDVSKREDCERIVQTTVDTYGKWLPTLIWLSPSEPTHWAHRLRTGRCKRTDRRTIS